MAARRATRPCGPLGPRGLPSAARGTTRLFRAGAWKAGRARRAPCPRASLGWAEVIWPSLPPARYPRARGAQFHYIHAELIFFHVFFANMAPRTKRLAQKHPRHDREPTPPPAVEFPNPVDQERFERLQTLKIGQSRYIDWDALEAIGLDEEVRELVRVGGWDRLFAIQEPVRRDTTLEVLALFSFDHDAVDTSFDTEDAICFRAFGQPHGMSLTQFSIYLGLYDQDYTDTIDYTQLLTNYPQDLTPAQVSHDLCGGR